MDEQTRKRIEAAERRRLRELARMTEWEREAEQKRTALPAQRLDNRAFSLWKQ